MTDVKISNLPPATSSTGADLIPIVQGGTTKKLTNTDLFTNSTMVNPALGTPASGTLTNCTGLPITSGVSGLASGASAFLSTPTSANLRSMVTDETGEGFLVFSNGPTFIGMPLIPTYSVNAAGSTEGDAAAITTGFTVVALADGTKGVKLPTAVAGFVAIIKNNAAAALKVYPNTNDQINALTVTTGAYSMPADTSCILIAYSDTIWFTVPLVAS